MSIFKNLFRKKPTILELVVVYSIPDEEELKRLTTEYKEKHKKWKYYSEELALTNVEKEPSNEIEVPNKEDRGIIQIHLEEIYSINECDNADYSLIVLDSGMQLIVDYPIEKFKKYWKSKGFIVDELK